MTVKLFKQQNPYLLRTHLSVFMPFPGMQINPHHLL